ncbi:MAG: hypothetical protein ACOCU8_02705 [Patescibacteria group bacterium]
MPLTPEIIQEKTKDLPEKVKEAFFSSETSKTIREVGQKNNLHIDQIGILADLTGQVLLGILPVSSFTRHLSNYLHIDTETAKFMAIEINEKIFLPIREDLKKVNISKKEDTEPEKKKADSPPPPPTTEKTEEKETIKKDLYQDRKSELSGSIDNVDDPYREPIE